MEDGGSNTLQESFISQPLRSPLPESTIPVVLQRMATETPDDEAYIFRRLSGRDVITFRQLEERSMRVAVGLLELGVRPGDRILLRGPASPEWLYIDYALLKIKALAIRQFMNLDTGSSIRTILEKHRCVGVVIDPGVDDSMLNKLKSLLSVIGTSGKGEINRNDISGQIGPYLLMTFTTRSSDHDDMLSVSDLAGRHLDDNDRKRVDDITNSIQPTDLAVTFMTSGSCGLPKCVAFDHVSILMTLNTDSMGSRRQRYFNDRAFAWAGSALFTPLAGGLTLVHGHVERSILPRPQTLRMLDWMAEEKITMASLMPFMVHDIVEAAAGNPKLVPATLTRVFISGERLAGDLMGRALTVLPPATLVMYGSTEVGLIMVDSLHALYQSSAFAYSGPGKEIKLVDNATGDCVPVGEIGEVCVRGRGVFACYLDDAEKTLASKSPDGWVRTGDVGRMSSAGRLHLLGRKMEVISRGTRKLFPAALERILVECPQVERCAVVGIPDPRLYEEVCACVVPGKDTDLTEETLLEYVANQTVEESAFTFKHLLVLEDFPLNYNGKVDRMELKQQAIKLIELKCN